MSKKVFFVGGARFPKLAGNINSPLSPIFFVEKHSFFGGGTKAAEIVSKSWLLCVVKQEEDRTKKKKVFSVSLSWTNLWDRAREFTEEGNS